MRVLLTFVPMHNKNENVKVLFLLLISLVNIRVYASGRKCATPHISMPVFNQTNTK